MGKAPLKMYEKGILMNKKTTIVLSIVTVLSIVLSLCGCNNSKKTDEAFNFCTQFCEDVKSGDTGKIITYFNDPEITQDKLKEIIAPSGFNSEEAAVSASIKETLNYKVQEPVYDYKAKTATVYLSWEEADYNCDAVRTADSVTAMKSAIKTAPASIITSCVTVDLNGETPVITDPKSVIDAVYAFNAADHGILPGILKDYYSSGEWVLAPKGVYTNTKEIGVRLNFKKDVLDYRYVPGITYTVAAGDKVLFASDVLYLSDKSIRLDFTPDMTGPEALNEDGFFKDGKYTVMVFDEHSNDIAGFTCEVKTVPVEKEEIEFEEFSNDQYLSDLIYEFKDSELMSRTFVYNSGWWDYDGTSVGKSAFGSDTTIIGFSLAVSNENDMELYYEYYYSEEADFSGISESKPVYERSCKPSLYQDLACYDLDYSSGDIKPGYYGLVVYGDAAKKHIVFTASCMVVEETSAEMN